MATEPTAVSTEGRISPADLGLYCDANEAARLSAHASAPKQSLRAAPRQRADLFKDQGPFKDQGLFTLRRWARTRSPHGTWVRR